MAQISKKFYLKIVAIPVAMFLFAFAMIPLYNVLCDVTGLNGRSSSLQNPVDKVSQVVDRERSIRVTFLSTVASGMPVRFYPKEGYVDVHPGEIKTVFFIVENRSNKPILGQAIPSVAPEKAASDLQKIECFCFTKQLFAPNDTVEMPVQLVINPELDEEVEEMTLSYTFFRLDEEVDPLVKKSIIKTHSPLGVREIDS